MPLKTTYIDDDHVFHIDPIVREKFVAMLLEHRVYKFCDNVTTSKRSLREELTSIYKDGFTGYNEMTSYDLVYEVYAAWKDDRAFGYDDLPSLTADHTKEMVSMGALSPGTYALFESAPIMATFLAALLVKEAMNNA